MPDNTHELAVTFDGDAPVWARWTGAAPKQWTPRERSPERLDEAARLLAWVVENCQGMTRTDAAGVLPENFGKSPKTRNRELGPGDVIGGKLTREDTRWALREGD